MSDKIHQRTPESVIAEFDWLKLGEIDAIRIEFSTSGKGTTLLVSTSYILPEEEEQIILKFDGVRNLKMCTSASGTLSFGELNVENISGRQLEGINYLVKDHLSDITFYCSSYYLLDQLPP